MQVLIQSAKTDQMLTPGARSAIEDGGAFSLTTPVVFFIFRRYEATKRVLDAIRTAQPQQLFVIADGPRNADEMEQCLQTRALIEGIEWPCQVIRNYSDVNLGLKTRIASGLDWVFSQVEAAIILEDDCLPEPSFFQFCQEMLNKYSNDARIMHISVDCFVQPQDTSSSYYFSRYPQIWGWATWRRAWQLYDADIKSWQTQVGRQAFLEKLSHRDEKRFWSFILDQVATGKLNTWDFQWSYACLRHNGLSINSSVNLVTNIGFGAEATNTQESNSPFADMKTHPILFPLKHPERVEVDAVTDRKTAQFFFTYPSLWKRVLTRVSRLALRNRPIDTY